MLRLGDASLQLPVPCTIEELARARQSTSEADARAAAPVIATAQAFATEAICKHHANNNDDIEVEEKPG